MTKLQEKLTAKLNGINGSLERQRTVKSDLEFHVRNVSRKIEAMEEDREQVLRELFDENFRHNNEEYQKHLQRMGVLNVYA